MMQTHSILELAMQVYSVSNNWLRSSDKITIDFSAASLSRQDALKLLGDKIAKTSFIKKRLGKGKLYVAILDDAQEQGLYSLMGGIGLGAREHIGPVITFSDYPFTITHITVYSNPDSKAKCLSAYDADATKKKCLAIIFGTDYDGTLCYSDQIHRRKKPHVDDSEILRTTRSDEAKAQHQNRSSSKSYCGFILRRTERSICVVVTYHNELTSYPTSSAPRFLTCKALKLPSGHTLNPSPCISYIFRRDTQQFSFELL